MSESYKALTFFINKNKYVLRWEESCAQDMRYILVNYFLDYIKDNWSAFDVCIKVRPAPDGSAGHSWRVPLPPRPAAGRPARHLFPRHL